MDPLMKKIADVSVIVPCYRCSITIERALDSIVAQTLQPNEIILIDDCSNDANHTLDKLYKFKESFSDLTVKIIALSENVGAGQARNAGWNIANSTWVAFLDADDAWHPQKLEFQLNWLQFNSDIDLCGHLSLFVKSIPENSLSHLTLNSINSRNIHLSDMLISNCLPTRTVMIRTNIPLRFGVQRNAEDYLLWMQVIASGFKASCLQLQLAFCFRPEYSSGGVSGQLITHEKWELKTLHSLYLDRSINFFIFIIASSWSLLKFIRRIMIRILNR